MHRRALLVAAAGAAALPGLAVPASAWADHPPPPSHDNNFDGRAMAPDGSRFVLAPAWRAANELLVLPTTGLPFGGQRLVAANHNLTLLHPAFWPDGGSIVAVASWMSPSRSLAAGEIWRIDLADGRTEAIGDPWQAYCHPAVSPDGRRLAYWKGVAMSSGAAANFAAREAVANWVLTERDLASGRESRLYPAAFERVGPVFYDPKGRGVFTTVGPDADAPRVFALVGPQAAQGGPLTAFLPAGAFGDSGGGELSGVTADGRIFVQWGRSVVNETPGVRMAGAFSDGGPLVEAFAPGEYGAQHMMCSADGKTFAAVRDDLDTPPGPQGRQTLYVQRPGERLTFLLMNGVHASIRPFTLTAAGSRL